MGAPAHDARHGEHRGVQLQRDAQHLVDEAAVKVHVGADALEDAALARDDPGRQLLDALVEREVALPALFGGQLLDVALEHALARVGQRIDRVAHAVDEALAVEGLAVYDLFKVGLHLVPVLPVAHVGADVLHHLHDLDVGAAVLGPLERGHRRGDGGIGVRARGGDHARGEGGVVAAAVLHVQYERGVQHLGLGGGVALVGAQHHQQVFGGGQRGVGAVDDHALHALVVVVGVVAVHRQQREFADQLDTLAQRVGHGGVLGVPVVGGQRQYAARHGVHDIVAGRLHDDIAGEIGGQRAALADQLRKLALLRLVGQLAHQQQVGDALKAQLVLAQLPDQLLDAVAAVPQLAVAGRLFAVHHARGHDLGDVGQARQHAVAVLVAQALVHAVLVVQPRRDAVVLPARRLAFLRKIQHALLIHRHPLLPPSAPRPSPAPAAPSAAAAAPCSPGRISPPPGRRTP